MVGKQHSDNSREHFRALIARKADDGKRRPFASFRNHSAPIATHTNATAEADLHHRGFTFPTLSPAFVLTRFRICFVMSARLVASTGSNTAQHHASTLYTFACRLSRTARMMSNGTAQSAYSPTTCLLSTQSIRINRSRTNTSGLCYCLPVTHRRASYGLLLWRNHQDLVRTSGENYRLARVIKTTRNCFPILHLSQHWFL